MKYLNAFFSCFFIFILFSCDIVTFDKDSVSSNPGSEVAWYEGNTVDFTFSCDVIKYYAEQAVYIKSGTVLYENKYNWNGKTLSVVGLVRTCSYSNFSNISYTKSENNFVSSCVIYMPPLINS